MPATKKSSTAKKPIRPWQGTMLGVLNILGMVMLGVTTIMIFIGGAIFSSMSGGEVPMGIMMGTMGTFIAIPLLLITILGIFVTIGIFKGKKWALITTMIFVAISLLNSFLQVNIISLIVNGLYIYAGYICFKDPYYS